MEQLAYERALHVGVHGVVSPRPTALSPDGPDIYSLTAELASLWGLASTELDDAGPTRWGHNGAGEDLRSDGHSREAGWLQVAPTEGNSERALIYPALALLLEAVSRLATLELSRVHVVAPVTGKGRPMQAASQCRETLTGEPVSVRFEACVAGGEEQVRSGFRDLRSTGLTVDGLRRVHVASDDWSGAWRVFDDPGAEPVVSENKLSFVGTGTIPAWDAVEIAFAASECLRVMRSADAVGFGLISIERVSFSPAD